MPARNPGRRTAATRVAVHERWHGPRDPRTVDARRELAAEQLADAIEQVAREAPPLTEQQRARLAALLWRQPAKGRGGA